MSIEKKVHIYCDYHCYSGCGGGCCDDTQIEFSEEKDVLKELDSCGWKELNIGGEVTQICGGCWRFFLESGLKTPTHNDICGVCCSEEEKDARWLAEQAKFPAPATERPLDPEMQALRDKLVGMS